jgi:hypothetical protein
MTGRAMFTRMQDGTAEDYAIIEALEGEYFAKAARPRARRRCGTGLQRPGRLSRGPDTHSLQSATRALRNGEHTDYVVAALVHDIGDRLAPFSHGSLAAAVYFCEHSDENCFDPDYPSLPLEHFAPMVREVFSRERHYPG